MSFKEKAKKFGKSVKQFWKNHWDDVLLATGGLALTGAACYGAYKAYDIHRNRIEELTEKVKNEAVDTVKERTAWNEDWDQYCLELEHMTHQPYGPYKDDDFVDIYDGNCFIIAGPNSQYNENPDTIELYVLDNDGWYHRMPDDKKSA